MRNRRKYSDNDKAVALATLDANAGNLKHTARILKIPLSTVADWAKDRGLNADVAELRNRKRADLSSKLEEIALALADNICRRVKSDDSASIPLRDCSISLGVVVDKMLLLKGQPNSITSNVERTRTNEERAARILELIKPVANTGT